MDITIEYQPTREELLRVSKAGIGRWLRLITWALLLLAVSATFFVWVLSNGNGLAILLLITVVVMLILYRLAVRAFLRSRSAQAGVPATVHLTDDGYRCRTAEYELSYPWTTFDGVDSAADMWLLYKNGQIVAFLPRHLFNADQTAELEGVLRRIAG